MKRRLMIAFAAPAILLTGCDSISRFARVAPTAVAEASPAEAPAVDSPPTDSLPDPSDTALAPPADFGSTAPITEAPADLNDTAYVGDLATASDVKPARASAAHSPPAAHDPPAAHVAPVAEDPPAADVALASATSISSAARRTFDAVVAALPNPAADHRERLAREIASFRPFPFAFDLPTVAGGSLDSRDLDAQLVVVDIWATWCGPCRKAIPDFVATQDAYASRGVQVVGITCDSADPAQAEEVARKAAEIGERMMVNYPLLIDDGTTTAQVPGFRGYPTTLFVTPEGQVLYKVTGMQSEAELAAILDHLLTPH